MGLVTGRAAECELKAEDDGKAATTEGGTAHTADEQAVREHGEMAGADAPTISALDELAELLRRHPVQVRVAPDGSRVHIRENQNWKAKNWETARRISQLVFQDCEVLDYLLHHGAEVISGRNIMEPERVENGKQ